MREEAVKAGFTADLFLAALRQWEEACILEVVDEKNSFSNEAEARLPLVESGPFAH